MKNPEAIAARRVVLVESGGGLRIRPVASEQSFEACPLPHLPLSFVNQLLGLGALFWEERRACIAAVLMLDRLTRVWLPVPPTQRCGRDKSRFRLLDSDYAHLPPHLLIGGSFQTLASASLFRAADVLPDFDGIHLAARIARRKRPEAFVFIRCAGETHLADPAAVFCDDLRTMLRRYGERLRVVGKHTR